MVVVVSRLRIHAAVVQQEAHREEVLVSRRGLGGSSSWGCRYCCMGLCTTSFIVELCLLWALIAGLLSSSKSIQCMHIDGLIPFISAKDHPIASWCSLSTLNSFSFST